MLSFEKKLVRINELRDKIINKRIVIFGGGHEGKVLKTCLDILSLEVDYFVDNFCYGKGKSLLSKDVYAPNKLNDEKNKDIAILVSSYRTNDISKQLTMMGFKNEKDFFIMKEDREQIKEKIHKLIKGVPVGKYTYGYEEKCIKGVVESIGSFCSINETSIAVANHPLDYITTHPLLYVSEQEIMGSERVPGILNEESIKACRNKTRENYGKVKIENDVWIGANSILFRGITINNSAVVAAGAVVTEDVPSYAIVAGVPAKILRYRFNEEDVKILNEIKWWDWSDERIIENSKYFYNPKVFIEKFREKTF